MTIEKYAKKARECYRFSRMIDQYDMFFLPFDELQESEKAAWFKVGEWILEQVEEAEARTEQHWQDTVAEGLV